MPKCYPRTPERHSHWFIPTEVLWVPVSADAGASRIGRISSGNAAVLSARFAAPEPFCVSVPTKEEAALTFLPCVCLACEEAALVAGSPSINCMHHCTFRFCAHPITRD